MKKRLSLYLAFIVTLLYIYPASAQQNYPPKRELRGVWIATVANIDWPSTPYLSSNEQKDEFKYILDQHYRTGINTVFGQVRPNADAFYAKSREPWSYWLTGQQGRSPYPEYDPMQFMIEECHKRGMEFHAWFNPYRATHRGAKGAAAPNHITKKKPEWFFNYGGQMLFNPGLPEVREYIVSVIMDVVRNYDVDGVHFDDYFYPYPEPGQYIADWATFKKYPNGFTTIEDWRRNNVDILVKMVHDSIVAAKPKVKFGISPFGIWKNSYQDPDGSETRGGASYYNQYADTRKWLEEGWVDYMLPQVYFNIGHPKADFETLTDWWANNSFGRHIYIGMGAYRIGTDPSWRNPKHMSDQIKFTRAYSEVSGQVYFSSKSLTRNIMGFTDTLKNNYYRYKSLPPTMPWIDSIPPNAPGHITAEQTNPGVVKLSWTQPELASDGDAARAYVIYRLAEGEIFDINDPRKIIAVVYNETSFVDTEAKTKQVYTYVVTSLDRMQNESIDQCLISIPVN
ncbi:glycoside hydrolase [Solitalea longa]|uniref:Glycoside hydrolase n=1 Tax=Solitalea longa TaxID=2079460 RepID=A0A2S5A3C1_9SPHI|nr:family 10 glycosylhydrolase [Solitalea longa]POY37014.1 glycoside hydrolase [Solitalea longa]